jgi:hypothetical protein
MPPVKTRFGVTQSTVVPRRAIRSLIDACAPLPSETIAITAPMPITMPSIVSSERILLARSAPRATAMVSVRSMVPSLRASGFGRWRGAH